MEQLDLLKRLQAIDGELFQLRRQQEEKPHELEAIHSLVVEQETKVKAAEDKLKALQLSQKEKEIDLKAREESVKKLQGQLFQVKTNREYTAMQKEIESQKADNSLFEEAIIKIFDDIDAAAGSHQKEQERLSEQKERQRREQTRIERELAEIVERIGKLESDRKVLTPQVDPKILFTYEEILEDREGLALVPLEREACGGCNRRLPPQIVNIVRMRAQLITCENCNRILYADEDGSKL